MIEVIIDDQVIKVNPKLTIEKYQKIQSNPMKYESITEMLGLYLGVDSSVLNDVPKDQINIVQSLLSNHVEQPNTDEIVFVFEFEGVKYGLENDWQNMTWGQWTDLEVFSQEDKIKDHIHVIMSLLYRPIESQVGTEYKLTKFKSSEVMDRAQKFLNLPVNYWFGCSTFFLQISTEYINGIHSSLKVRTMLEKWLTPMKRILPKWLHPKVPLDSTLNYLSTSSKETSQNTTS
jgi:hypothetical protein